MPLCPPRRFQTPKAGNRPDECEDTSRVVYPYSTTRDVARIALCDGASESAFARSWAQILADAFISRPIDLSELTGPSLTGWLEPCEEQWSQAVPWDRIPWHGEAKTRAGALATLLALTVNLTPNPSGGFPWQAAAIGDCCLFVIRDGELNLAFPMDSSAQFNNTPSLICSNPANNRGLWGRVVQLQGEFRSGDAVILASDALAAWVLQECESGGKPWETLLSLGQAEWEDWVQERRAERSMRNDDTTLIIIPVK